MAWIRKIVFWAHLSTGICVAALVLVMSITGFLLSFQQQIIDWVETKDLVTSTPTESAEKLSPKDLLQNLNDIGENIPGSISWTNNLASPAKLSYGSQGTNYVDAYSGEILGRHSEKTRSFFESVENWHRWLSFSEDQRRLGRSITGLANLGFFFMLLTGFYLWWPRNWSWKSLRNILWFRRKLSSKARNYNWHHVIGFWSLIPLVMVVGTAVIFSFGWADKLVFQAFEKAMPSEPAKNLSVALPYLLPGARPFDNHSVLEKKIEIYHPEWRSFELEIPRVDETELHLRVFEKNERQLLNSAEMTIERTSGSVAKWEPYNTLPSNKSWRSFIRYTHTGELLGFIGQMIAALASLAATFLVWTGLNLSWKRFRSWHKRRTN